MNLAEMLAPRDVSKREVEIVSLVHSISTNPWLRMHNGKSYKRKRWYARDLTQRRVALLLGLLVLIFLCITMIIKYIGGP